MTFRTLYLAVLILFLLAFTASGVNPKQNVAYAAYVDPALKTELTDSAQVSVIVSGTDTNELKKLVQQHGGLITSDLWLINAVTVDISPEKISALASNREFKP